MGIESRDYIRDDDNRSYTFRFGPPQGGYWAVKYLLIANVVVFLLQLMTRDPVFAPQIVGGLTSWLSLNLSNIVNPDPTQGFQIWRLLTYGFCHGNFTHIFFNMFVLWMFGRVIEPIYGSREFLFFFLGGVLISGVCHVLMQAVQQNPAGVVGASGGVMAVVFLTAATFPRMEVLLMFVFPIQLRFLAVLYAVVDILGALNPQGSNVAHFAHLGGAGFGIAYKYLGWRLSGMWDTIIRKIGRHRIRSTRPKVKIYRPHDSIQSEPSQEEMKRRVDEILEKIHKHGEASLTDKEREFLSDASRRYRK
ncbi:MAG: rhomboid family intramembrane serine protease [Planctomycetaceae bacterium]